MNAIYSPATGVLVVPTDDSSVPEVRYLGIQHPWSGVETLYMLSTIRDWQAVDADSLPSALQRCTSEYWLKRAASSLACLIEGVSETLTLEVLEHVEEILQTRCSSHEVLSQLLIAPLIEPQRASHLAQLALGNGFATLASLLDRLVDLQPLLRRLADHWLDLPPKEFLDLTVTRETCWASLSETSLLLPLLEANDGAAFREVWNNLAFNEPSTPGSSRSIRKRRRYL